jgi:hypothetical protein
MNAALLGAAVVLGGAGVLMTTASLSEGLIMEGQHWIMLGVFLLAGYVIGRLWATPAQMLGLP